MSYQIIHRQINNHKEYITRIVYHTREEANKGLQDLKDMIGNSEIWGVWELKRIRDDKSNLKVRGVVS